MRRKRLLIGAAVITAAVTAFTTNIISVPFELLRSWFTQTATLGNEVRVVVPKDFPPIREFYIARPITGTHVEIRGFEEK